MQSKIKGHYFISYLHTTTGPKSRLEIFLCNLLKRNQDTCLGIGSQLNINNVNFPQHTYCERC